MLTQLPQKPGPHKINVKEHLRALYKLDSEIFNIAPISFPFETPEELLKYLTEDHKTTTIIWNDDKGEFVGYFAYEENVEIPDTIELINLGTRPMFQGQGYGTKMLHYYHNLFRDKHFRLVTHPDNPARKLYEKVGYVPVKIIENYFGDGQSRVLYFK